jgi:hypothetical protein
MANESPTTSLQRREAFTIEYEALVRRVVPRRGRPYEHRCKAATFRAIAEVIDQHAGEPFVLEDLTRRTACTWTQAAVALAFLKERGCAVPCPGRRTVAASRFVLEDALTEWHALCHFSSKET